MAFNIQSFVRISSSGNASNILLADGTYIGGPDYFTYITAQDLMATITGAGYFNTMAHDLDVYDRIYCVDSTGAQLDLYVASITSNPTLVTTGTAAVSGDVIGPAASTDNALVRFDGVTGKLVQNSVGILSDVGALSGLTLLDVDNVRIDLNTISSTNANGNINLTPNGTGLNVLANAQVTNVTASRAVVTDASSNLNESVTTAAELAFVNGVTSAIQTQIDTKISQSGAQIYAASATGNDTYVVTLSPVPSGYVNGMVLNVKPDTANTGPATINVNGLGAISILHADGSVLNSGDIGANQIVNLVYNSTGPKFQIQSALGSSAALTGNTYNVNQVAHGFTVGKVVYLNSTTYTAAIASADTTSEVVGIIISATDADNFVLQFGGRVTGLSALTAGSVYYLSPSAAGDLTATKPTTIGQVVKPLLVADTTTSGFWVNYLGALL